MLSWNLDIGIFFVFLAFNLGVGLWYSRGIKTLRHYAIGGKQFSTIIIALTIAATYATGTNLGQVGIYKEGLLVIVAHVGNALALGLLGFLYVRAGCLDTHTQHIGRLLIFL